MPWAVYLALVEVVHRAVHVALHHSTMRVHAAALVVAVRPRLHVVLGVRRQIAHQHAHTIHQHLLVTVILLLPAPLVKRAYLRTPLV